MKIASKSYTETASPRLRSCVLPLLMPFLLTLAVAGCSDEARKTRLLDNAKAFFDAGEYDKAKIEYMNLMRKDPQNATAIQQLGLIWSEQGAPLRAIPFLRKSIELTPDNISVRTKLALALLEVGARQEARKEAITILSQNPSHDEALYLLVDTTVTKEEMEDSDQRLQKLKAPDRAAVHLALAGLSGRRGDLDAAEKEVQQALSLDPKSIPGHMAMANLLVGRKELSKAGEAFTAAADLAPVRSPARLKLADFKAASGAPQEAKALLQGMTRKAPDFLPAWRLQAQIAFGEKNYDGSLALLDNILTRDPANVDARILQARTMLSKGEVKQTITRLEDLRTLFPKAPLVLYHLARAYLQDANPAQARVVLDQAMAASPEYADAALLLAELNLGSGHAQETVALMQALLKKQPALERAQLLLADAYRTLGRFDEAAALFREQIKISPKNATAYLMLGKVLRQKGAVPEARAVFVKAQELEPDNLLPTYQLVELDIRDKEFKAAHERAAVHLQRTPGSADAHILDGKIFVAQSDWDRAEAAFLKSMELDAGSSSAYGELINTYILAGKLPQAKARLEEHLTKEPDDPRALLTVAAINENQNELPKARDAYEKLLAQKPDLVVALNNLACLYSQKMNQLDKGYELARKARTLAPADPAVADTLGWILYKRGDYQQALTLLTESAGKLPNVPEIQFHLGMAAYMMGQTGVARTALKVAAAAPSDFPGKTEIREKLALLESGGAPNAVMSAADLEAALQKQPDDPLLQMRLAEAYEQQSAFEKAVGIYEKVLKQNPKLTTAVVKLAQLHAGPLKNPAKALEFAEKARELAPNDSRTAGILGALSYRAGDFPKAYGLLQESASGLPDDPAVLQDFAWAAYSQAKVDEARKAMQRLLKAASTPPQLEDATSFLDLTAVDQGAKDPAAWASQVEGVLRKDPGHVPALMARAAIHVGQGEAKAAADLYSKVLGRFPDFAPAQKSLASLYATEPANLQKGYDLALKARKTLSEDPDLAQTLGSLAYQRNEFAFAAQLLQESARKRPLDAKGLYYLGKALLATKEKSEGRTALEKALATGLQDPLAADVKTVLRDLDKN